MKEEKAKTAIKEYLNKDIIFLLWLSCKDMHKLILSVILAALQLDEIPNGVEWLDMIFLGFGLFFLNKSNYAH